MSFFLTTSLGRSILVGAGIFVLLAGAYFYIDHKARVDERNAAIARQLEETEKGRKLRETNDAKARNLDDDAALRCLRNPEGCR